MSGVFAPQSVSQDLHAAVLRGPASIAQGFQADAVQDTKLTSAESQTLYADLDESRQAARAPEPDPLAIADSLARLNSQLVNTVGARSGLADRTTLQLNRTREDLAAAENQVQTRGAEPETQKQLEETLDQLEKVLEESTPPPSGIPPFVMPTPSSLATARALPTVTLPGSSGPPNQGPARSVARVRCDHGRWQVEVLSDRDARQVDYSRVVGTSIADLAHLTLPRTELNTPRVSGFETTVYSVRGDLVTLTEENDLDVHLVLADSDGTTMVAVFPSDDCQGVDNSVQHGAIVDARRVLTEACGDSPTPGKFLRVSGTATVTGVGLIDDRRDSLGSAPNGIQLHPVLAVSDVTCTVVSSGSYQPSPAD